jgi:hypothetical protein
VLEYFITLDLILETKVQQSVFLVDGH